MSELTAAYHEAGHAVVALVTGNAVRSVDIIPDDEARREGLTRTRVWTACRYLRWMIELAGPVAQRWADPDCGEGCGADFAAIEGIVNELVERERWCLDDKAMLAKCRGIEEAMRDRINELRPQIELVAAELLKRKSMTGAEIGALLGWSDELKEAA